MKGLHPIEFDFVASASHVLSLPMPLPPSSTVETFLTTGIST